MSKIVISDTSCLIAFERINRIELLHSVFPEIITTNQVRREFGDPFPDWIEIRDASDVARVSEFEKLVDKGEASAIALAMEVQNALLIIDEKKGRDLARQLNLEIIGTLRILLLAKQKGIIPAVKPLFAEFERNDFRFSKALVNELLAEAGEKA